MANYLLRAASGQTTLPLLYDTAKLLENSWADGGWAVYCSERGETRAASHFVTKTGLGMSAAAYYGMGRKHRTGFYTDLLCSELPRPPTAGTESAP